MTAPVPGRPASADQHVTRAGDDRRRPRACSCSTSSPPAESPAHPHRGDLHVHPDDLLVTLLQSRSRTERGVDDLRSSRLLTPAADRRSSGRSGGSTLFPTARSIIRVKIARPPPFASLVGQRLDVPRPRAGTATFVTRSSSASTCWVRKRDLGPTSPVESAQRLVERVGGRSSVPPSTAASPPPGPGHVVVRLLRVTSTPAVWI